MEFANESAIVPDVCKRARHKRVRTWIEVVSVAIGVRCAWVHPREETRSTRCTDWTLTVGMCEGDSIFYEAINVRG